MLPQNITDTVFETIHLTCSSRALPAPNISWLKDNQLINSSSSNLITISTLKGDTVSSSTLIIEELNLITSGLYRCLAVNQLVVESSAESADALVTVHCK